MSWDEIKSTRELKSARHVSSKVKDTWAQKCKWHQVYSVRFHWCHLVSLRKVSAFDIAVEYLARYIILSSWRPFPPRGPLHRIPQDAGPLTSPGDLSVGCHRHHLLRRLCNHDLKVIMVSISFLTSFVLEYFILIWEFTLRQNSYSSRIQYGPCGKLCVEHILRSVVKQRPK